ncbi:unnamed protein product [Linum tenue]|uniref:Uncharacterized protein n=1 Tax=Linum tenue TaxID=586396 RepID=A0AAV0IL77_9ROSI|nr:unnamed protein product [Linum tenue]
MFGSGSNISRGNATSPLDMPPLTECLHLEPITLGSQKYTRSGELRRVLGFGSASEDHSFGVAQPKPPPVATEELKLFKESVLDASRKARDRSKIFKDSIIKLDKYKEVLTSKKRQRSEFSVTERSNGPNLAKMGSQIHRSPHEGMPQRLEERAKSVGLNKRVRTSVADVRPDGKRSPSPRQQLAMEKAGDALPDVGAVGVRFEEKIRRLPAGGEGWDTKNKKKRSVGMVSGRVINSDRDLKRPMLPKMSSDSKLRSCDAQDFRSKSSPVSGINKSDGSLEPTSSDTSTPLRSEMESGPPPRDRMALLEKKVLAKASNKPTFHEENLASSPSTLIKAKVSRAPRTGSIMQLDSSLKGHPSSTSLQGSDQASSSNKVPVPGMANNPKRQMSAGSSSHAMAQWVGQRPHKSSRTRRANIITPVSNNGEAQTSSPGFVPSDFSGRMSSIATNGSLVPSGLDNSTPKVKREVENVPSPFGFSESEESGAGESKVKDKGRDSCETTPTALLKPGSFVIPSKKNKLPTNEVGEGFRRQGRTGRSPSLTRPGVNSGREKLENQPTMKPIPIVKPPDKNKSKSGRPPSKKLKDRKAVSRIGPVLNGNSSDYTGESDDDHEELFAAASSARNASSLACSGSYWKKMEPIFASVSSGDTSYLKEQLSFAEELDESLSQMLGVEYNVLGVLMHKDSPNCSGEKLVNGPNKKSANSTSLRGKVDMERLEKGAPLYQRVLSALIEEDECEEFYEHGEGKNVPHYASDDSHCGSCNLIDIEPRDRDRTESEVESVNFQNQRSYVVNGFSCNKSVASNSIRNSTMSSPLYSNGQWRSDDEVSHSDLAHGSEISSCDMGLLQTRELTTPGFSSANRQYQLMCLDDKLLLELQSIGICPEKLPDLAEGEEVISQDIAELKEGLYEQIGEKRRKLEKIDRATLRDKDVGKRSVEKNAMDQLVEIAYRKRLACRGNTTSKAAVRKVPRQVALGFIRRTLGRCKKFEDGGISCFSEPALQDALFSTPPCNNEAKSADCVGSGTASNTPNDVSNHQTEARLSGGVASSPLERNDSLCDSFERGGSRRAKAKPTKQKSAAAAAAAATAAANGPCRSSHPTGAPNGRSKPEREVKPKEAEEEAMDLPLDELDKLGVSADDGNQDLGSIFNLLDDDGLQDHYSIGLEIPMDDLSELNLM